MTNTTYELFAENSRTYKTRKTAVSKFEAAVEKLSHDQEQSRFDFIVAVNEEGRFYVVVRLRPAQCMYLHYFIGAGCCVTN